MVNGNIKLMEFRTIIRYLSNRTATDQLYQAHPMKRVRADQLLNFNIGIRWARNSSDQPSSR